MGLAEAVVLTLFRPGPLRSGSTVPVYWWVISALATTQPRWVLCSRSEH